MLQPSSNGFCEFLEDDPNKDTDKAIYSRDDINNNVIPFTEATNPSSFQSWKVDEENVISNEMDTRPLLNTS